MPIHPPTHELRGLLCDLDGTLTAPNLDFPAIRRRLGIPAGRPVLEYLAELPRAEADARRAQLEEEELTVARATRPNKGFAAFADWLAQWREEDPLRAFVVITRNCRAAAEITLERLALTPDLLLAREDAPPKPDPTAIHTATTRFGLPLRQITLLGDFIFDLQAAANAGVPGIYLHNDVPDPACLALATAAIPALDAFPAWLRAWEADE